mmetsp:Transcript_20470/g.56815  ORF Transcript_20470/g.56815 Transcript_20470/m.56815 type:complete len:365 (-) Transcript_20470:450-1544(-)
MMERQHPSHSLPPILLALLFSPHIHFCRQATLDPVTVMSSLVKLFAGVDQWQSPEIWNVSVINVCICVACMLHLSFLCTALACFHSAIISLLFLEFLARGITMKFALTLVATIATIVTVYSNIDNNYGYFFNEILHWKIVSIFDANPAPLGDAATTRSFESPNRNRPYVPFSDDFVGDTGHFEHYPDLRHQNADVISSSSSKDWWNSSGNQPELHGHKLSRSLIRSDPYVSLCPDSWPHIVESGTALRNMITNCLSGSCPYNLPMNCWDTSSVTNMKDAFAWHQSFNQPVKCWDTSKVTDMYGMFFEARLFNQPIGNWDVSSVKLMVWMFGSAVVFNQPIGMWNLASATWIESMCNILHVTTEK